MRHLLLLSLLSACCQSVRAQEEIHPATNSKEFVASFDASINGLAQRGFGDALQSASLGSVSGPEAEALLRKIRREDKLAGQSLGDRGVEYDVILQPGHYLRKEGKTGTSGASVSERALVAYVVGEIAKDLQRHSLNVLIISADDFHRPLRAKIFMALHADGSVAPCKSGPSLGYEKNTSMHAMHAIGWGLGQALGYTYGDFMKDNLTVNEEKYYMFSQVKTSVAKGILEIGELTCMAQEDRLIVNADKVAFNLSRAMRFVLNAP